MSILRQCGVLGRNILNRSLQFPVVAATTTTKKFPLATTGQIGAPANTRGHKNFGHEKEDTPSITKYFHLILGTLFVICLIDFRKVKKFLMPKVDADAGEKPPSTLAKGQEQKPGSKKIGFRDRKIMEYENRIRKFSTPDKIFRYFATVKLPLEEGGSEIFMTPDDFLRSIYPGMKQPEGNLINELPVYVADICIKLLSLESLIDGSYLIPLKIIEYENRIRQFSTPDKVFRYFATVQVPTSDDRFEVFMTPGDFLTSMTPGIKQPEGLGLDQFRRYDPKEVMERLDLHLDPDSIFYKLGSYGLISFSDYIFLLTVLSTSRRHFEIAFRMFDLNGDGDVDSGEFLAVANLVLSQTSIGSRHRDHAHTGSTFKGVNSALTTYFFGPKMDQKLTIESFLNFQRQLQDEMLSLEFDRKKHDENGRISEADFADLMIAYAGYNQKKKQKQIKRVKQRFKDNSQGISKTDYVDFFHFLSNINDVDTALTFYHIAGASIDQATLKHVAKTVAMVNLSDHAIDVVFTIFDENLDGQLSNKEFVSVMKDRIHRGLEKSKDTGFVKLLYSVMKCAKEAKPVLLDV